MKRPTSKRQGETDGTRQHYCKPVNCDSEPNHVLHTQSKPRLDADTAGTHVTQHVTLEELYHCLSILISSCQNELTNRARSL